MKKKSNILIITSWAFSDALIQTYTLPYIRIIEKQLAPGSKILLITQDKESKQEKITSNIQIEHISLTYIPFSAKAFFSWAKTILQLRKIIRQESIMTIHCWCTPSGMIGHILSKLTNTELIIDSYEPHAEAMVENGAWKKNSFAFKLLFGFEKRQTERAKWLIATTEGMKSYAKEKYGHTKDNFFAKPACVDLQQFSDKNLKVKPLLKELDLENKMTCVYAGKFGGIYLDQEVFDFFKIAENYWGGQFRALILSSSSTKEIEEMAKKAGLNPATIVHRFVPHSEIANYMGLADFAITPVKSVPTKRYCTPIKNGEYWALGLPIVITKNISDDSEIIKDNKIGSILEDLNKEAYEKSVREIDNILKNVSKQDLYKKIRSIAEKHRNFSIAENIYKNIYLE